MSEKVLHVIVQAGGRGSRLRYHTWNKPKCLVSVRGKPILYHLFDTFADAKFIVIGDYLYDQLEKYLHVNPPPVDLVLVHAAEKGTASGIADAMKYVPKEAPLILIWSDLIFNSPPVLPQTNVPVVGITDNFICRWTVSPDGRLNEKPGNTGGVMGFFYFPRAALLPTPPAGGEFVKWFAHNVLEFETLNCPGVEELGEASIVDENNDRSGFCRYFNKVEISATQVVKTVLIPEYEELHAKEVAWYREAKRLGFRRIPKVYSEVPLVLERIKGHHAYQMTDLTERERRAVLADYLDSLMTLHDLADEPADPDDVEEVYITKTIRRVQSVACLIPGFDLDSITINGKKCRNIFAPKHQGILKSCLPVLQPQRFVPIHGDPTFSNTIIDDKLRVWYIDPRGYFAKPGIMGDEWYDFAKVYYSAVGGYDAFNRRKFKLYIDIGTVEVLMEEPLFASTARDIFIDYFGQNLARIQLLHGLIWLSLSGYVKDDIDSVLGSFYLGLYWLELATAQL